MNKLTKFKVKLLRLIPKMDKIMVFYGNMKNMRTINSIMLIISLLFFPSFNLNDCFKLLCLFYFIVFILFYFILFYFICF